MFTTSAKNSAWPDHKPTPPVRDPNYVQNFSAYERVYTVSYGCEIFFSKFYLKTQETMVTDVTHNLVTDLT